MKHYVRSSFYKDSSFQTVSTWTHWGVPEFLCRRWWWGRGDRNQAGRRWEPKDLSLNCISKPRTWALFRRHVYRKSHSGSASEIWLIERGSVIPPLEAKRHHCWDYSRKIRAAKTLLISVIFFSMGVHSPCSLHSLFNTGFTFLSTRPCLLPQRISLLASNDTAHAFPLNRPWHLYLPAVSQIWVSSSAGWSCSSCTSPLASFLSPPQHPWFAHTRLDWIFLF